MKLPLVFYKYTRYEYWPLALFYAPILPYWCYQAVKNKSITYFSAANPGIEMGGLFGASKTEILQLIDKKYLPISILIVPSDTEIMLEQRLYEHGLTFPLIVKPDIGERGKGVRKIEVEQDLFDYHNAQNSNYIIQEFVAHDLELGVFYTRMPNQKKGKVTSITNKKFLTVKGDGSSSIDDLLNSHIRSRFQLKRLRLELGSEINEILKVGEQRMLEPIGNHCRGTEFLNYNQSLSENLNAIFDKIALPIKGFYYGRFDIKVGSFEELLRGETIKILELNGVNSEPTHIYDSSHTLFKAYKDIMSHWRNLSNISKWNIQHGIRPATLKEFIKSYRKYRRLKVH